MVLTKKRMERILRDLLIITIGATIIAFAVKYIFDPSDLVTGGVSGLAIVVKNLTGRYWDYEVPLWLSNVILNVPIFLFAWKTDGFKSIIRTGTAWFIMTVELYLFPDYSFIPDNLLLTSIYGGIAFGVGTGLLLIARATTGGTDMLGNTISKYLRHISVGHLIEFLDGAVVVIGLFVFDVEHTLYAIISVFVMGRVMDYIIDRGKKAKIALIISSQPDKISQSILTELDRGVTSIGAIGEYSKEKKKVLLCVCTKRDIPDVKDIVKEYDKKAFFIVGNVSEAMGEGFVEHWT
ncbi:MAG: YitT family protein [Lachnospiraceae bacterium]|nr:YitT family protein [Lachnospiraceae bacterium]